MEVVAGNLARERTAWERRKPRGMNRGRGGEEEEEEKRKNYGPGGEAAFRHHANAEGWCVNATHTQTHTPSRIPTCD